MTNNINPNRNTNNTNRRQGTRVPLVRRRVTHLAITQQIEQLTQGANQVFAPLITQAYRAIQSNMQELLPNEMINSLLSMNQYDRTMGLQLFALRHGRGNQNTELAISYSDLTARMPHRIIDENRMNTLLRTPPEQRVAELQIMTLGLGIPQLSQPYLRDLYNQILIRTNNQPLDRNTINELSRLQTADRLVCLRYILNQMHAPAA